MHRLFEIKHVNAVNLFIRGFGGRGLHLGCRGGPCRLFKGGQFFVQPGGPGPAQFFGHHGGQIAAHGSGRIGQGIGHDRSARSAGNDAHHTVPAFTHRGAVAPARGFVGSTGGKGAEELHEYIARERVRDAHVHSPGQKVVATQQRAAVTANALSQAQVVAALRHAVQRPQHLRGRVHIEHAHSGGDQTHGPGHSHAQHGVAQERLLPLGCAHARGAGHKHGLAKSRSQDAAHRGHAQGEGIVQGHRALDVAVFQGFFHPCGHLAAFAAGFDPVHARRHESSRSWPHADHGQ